MPFRPPTLFVAWTSRGGRGAEIADALGGTSRAVYPRVLHARKLAPLRYAVSVVLTWLHLLRVRPRSVIVTNPPVFAGLAVAAYCAVARIPFALDAHPTAFGAKDHQVGKALLPVTRWLATRAAAVLVTTQEWVDLVQSWGGRGEILHEAPPPWSVSASEPISGRPRILYVGIFGGDEPIEALLEAARLVPDVDVFVTGDLDRCPPNLQEGVAANVTFTGYLQFAQYRQAVEDAQLLIALTTEPTSVMRAAYEGVYARRPLVITDTAVLRELFPSAVFTANTAEAIATAIRAAVENHSDLRDRADNALVIQQDRWNQQLHTLKSVLNL